MLSFNIKYLTFLIYIITKTCFSHKSISNFSIESFGINIPITLFDENEYSSIITKISIQAYNYCYISPNSLIPTQCVIDSSSPSLSNTNNKLKFQRAIFLVDNEELLKTLLYSESPAKQFQFKAFLYPSKITLKDIRQSSIIPIFLIEQKEFNLLLSVLTIINKANVITQDNLDFSIKIKYDNTNTLLPYEYISFSKHIPSIINTIITSILIYQLISSKCKYSINTKIFTLFICLKYLFSLFYFLWLNKLLTSNYRNANFLTTIALQCVFDILMSIIYSIFLTIHFTFIIMCSFGFGILYPAFSRDHAQIYFLVFIILYLFISSDNLVDYIDYKLFNSIKMSELKNMTVILSITCLCLIKIRLNMSILKEKIRYSIEYAHQYYYWLSAQHRVMQLLGLVIGCYAWSYLGIVLLYKERPLSPYYDIIKKVNTINIGEIFYLFSSILLIFKEKFKIRFDINLIDDNRSIKGRVLKCVIKANDNYDMKSHKERSIPLILVLPKFNTNTIAIPNVIDFDSLKLGNICEEV